MGFIDIPFIMKIQTMKKLFQNKIFKRTGILILLMYAITDLIEGIIEGWNSVH